MDDENLAAFSLRKKHRTALRELSSECAYDKEGFIALAKLGPGIGDKTMSELLEWGLVIEGECTFRNKVGYRITELGERASQMKLSNTVGRAARRTSSASRRLKPLPPRLKPLPPRLK